MNRIESAKREDKEKTEQFVVAKSDEGYRVFSPMSPATQFVVTDTGDDMTCTCPDFAENGGDQDWCCTHIKAVHAYMNTQQQHRGECSAVGAAEHNGTPPPKEPTGVKKSNSGGSDASMLIKRSVSPDGHVDSLSVEFSLPVGKLSLDEIKQSAERALKLETEITSTFLKQNGAKQSNRNGSPARVNGSPQASGISARLLNIEAMDTRRGRSLYINVLVNNQVAKLFGDEESLIAALASAGYANWPEQLVEGIELNLPCRAVTKRNGKYLNIDRLLPAPAQSQNGGQRDRQPAH